MRKRGTGGCWLAGWDVYLTDIAIDQKVTKRKPALQVVGETAEVTMAGDLRDKPWMKGYSCMYVYNDHYLLFIICTSEE